MLTRREVIGSSLSAAGVGLGGDAGTAGAEQTSVIDPRQLTELIAKLDAIGDVLARSNGGTFTGEFPLGDKLREGMVPFLRAQQKYPDFIEVGYGVFHQVYDWHVRNRQPLDLVRGPDGRYGLRYMFTRLLLRTDASPDFIGVAYDARG